MDVVIIILYFVLIKNTISLVFSGRQYMYVPTRIFIYLTIYTYVNIGIGASTS